MLDNVEALLKEGGASLDDIKLCTLYLRDVADASAVQKIIFDRLQRTLPLVTLKAPVCRPTWLVEMECIAVNSNGCKKFKNFC
jgi:enamine deaminase RidA (YjgF/YER057c/UK114 family)